MITVAAVMVMFVSLLPEFYIQRDQKHLVLFTFSVLQIRRADKYNLGIISLIFP